MATYDLYGYLSDCAADLQGALQHSEESLGVKFHAHESSYHGGEYFRFGNSDEEHFLLKWNIDPFDNEPVESSFSGYRILLYVNDTHRSEDLHKRLSQGAGKFVLLRHEDIESPDNSTD